MTTVRRPLLLGALVVLVGGAAALALLRAGPAPSTPPSEAGPPPRVTAPTTAVRVLPAPPPGPVRWIALGGGGAPDRNQVSLEQDLALALEVLGPGGRILFAGGPGTNAVQVLDREPRGDPLRRALGEIFAPRAGRDARYRPTLLPVHAPATRPALLAALEETLARRSSATDAAGGPADLLLFVAGHGERGEKRRDNVIDLWGGTNLSVAALADVLDAAPPQRRVRVVVATCFSGGFAELAFIGGDPRRGPAENDRCGLFAAPWDLESSGCDADPDRAAQEGFSVHFLHALRGQDREGRPLPPEQVDFDGDGRVSLLEAHARARIEARSFDVPTTTAERWLRAVAPVGGAEALPLLPEDRAVVAGLSQRLGLEDAADALALLERLESLVTHTESVLAQAEEEELGAWHRLDAALLSRWPVLDDPWHPDFAATLQADDETIRAFLAASPEHHAWRAARAQVDRLVALLDELRLRAAPVERLVRAHETLTLAGRLQARGGPDWERYERFLACERSAP